MKIGFSSSKCSSIAEPTTSFAFGPLLHDLLVALLLRHQAHVVLVLDLGDDLLVLLEDLALAGRDDHVVLGDRDAASVAYLNPRSLNASSTRATGDGPHFWTKRVDHLDGVLLAHRLVDEDVLVRRQFRLPRASASARSILSL